MQSEVRINFVIYHEGSGTARTNDSRIVCVNFVKINVNDIIERYKSYKTEINYSPSTQAQNNNSQYVFVSVIQCSFKCAAYITV